MRKIILVVTLFFLAVNTKAQQDPQYTQYMYNMNIINPPYAGSSDATSVGIYIEINGMVLMVLQKQVL